MKQPNSGFDSKGIPVTSCYCDRVSNNQKVNKKSAFLLHFVREWLVFVQLKDIKAFPSLAAFEWGLAETCSVPRLGTM